VDFYHIKFESDYSSTFDNVTGDTIYFKNGASITQGVEAESTILVGGGLACTSTRRRARPSTPTPISGYRMRPATRKPSA